MKTFYYEISKLNLTNKTGLISARSLSHTAKKTQTHSKN